MDTEEGWTCLTTLSKVRNEVSHSTWYMVNNRLWSWLKLVGDKRWSPLRCQNEALCTNWTAIFHIKQSDDSLESLSVVSFWTNDQFCESGFNTLTLAYGGLCCKYCLYFPTLSKRESTWRVRNFLMFSLQVLIALNVYVHILWWTRGIQWKQMRYIYFHHETTVHERSAECLH